MDNLGVSFVNLVKNRKLPAAMVACGRMMLGVVLAAAGCGESVSTTNLSTAAEGNPELAERAKADAAKAEEQAKKGEAAALRQPLGIEDDANR
jgi:hypothetical protein